MMRSTLLLCAAIVASSCQPEPVADEPANVNPVQSSGKQDVPLGEVPEAVLAAARERVPQITIASAEAETRDGRRYFDIGGTLADGAEIELDIMEDGGRWQVVEVQQDIAFAAAPAPVQAAARGQDAALKPTRVIESRQEDGLVIYEVYAPEGSDPQGRKIEVKWDGREASVLAQEWAH